MFVDFVNMTPVSITILTVICFFYAYGVFNCIEGDIFAVSFYFAFFFFFFSKSSSTKCESKKKSKEFLCPNGNRIIKCIVVVW